MLFAPKIHYYWKKKEFSKVNISGIDLNIRTNGDRSNDYKGDMIVTKKSATELARRVNDLELLLQKKEEELEEHKAKQIEITNTSTEHNVIDP